MDEQLEKPSASISQENLDVSGEADQFSDEDDGGPDWTKLSALSSSISAKPFIPKRGDKEFEPSGGIDSGGKGTNLQQHRLESVRTAMFTALDVERTMSSKVASYAVWCPEISRARIINARGSFHASMGHNVPRTLISKDAEQQHRKVAKTTELLPEEALYLIERGSLFCWSHIRGENTNEGTPMSVQQAYAEMIGTEDLTLERYLVYAYLKRLGYIIIRARAPDSYYNTPRPLALKTGQANNPGLLGCLASLFASPFRNFFVLPLSKQNWWRPLSFSFPHRFLNYSSIFSSLRFLPSGFSRSLRHSCPKHQPLPYEVFFHLYKPATPYRKTSPPPPDYSLIVVDARNTPMPTLHELCTLFGQLPELPAPTPRKRPDQVQKNSSLKTVRSPEAPRGAQAEKSSTLFSRLWNFLRRLLRLAPSMNDSNTGSTMPARRPNPFQMLKMGKKMIVVATVDSGMISFFRFCQGSFDEWPMI